MSKRNLGNAIRDYAKQHKIDAEELVVMSFFKMSEQVVKNSPVYDIKGGRFRSNWFAKANNASTKKTTSLTRNSMDGVEDVARKAYKNKTSAYLTNNLKYARVIEYGLYPNPPKKGRGRTRGGYSTQAYSGLVRLTILRFKRDFLKIVRSDRIKTAGRERRVWKTIK